MYANINILPILKGENYSNWKFRVKSLLEEKQVLHTLEKENKDDTIEKIKLDDSKAKAIIIQCITDKHLSIIQDCKTAREMIEKLDSVFQRKSVFTKLTLKRKLLSLKLQRNEKLEDHVQKFEKIVYELENIDKKLDDSDKICHLLITLNDDYENAITAIETINTDINLEFVKSRLIDVELKIKIKI